MGDLKLPLVRCLSELKFDFNDFENNKNTRIIFQKYCIFLEDFFGIGTGEYNLYLYGPYNPSLASIGYEIASEYNIYKKAAQRLELTDRAVRILAKLRDIFFTHRNHNRELLEIYTTYFYLTRREGLDREAALRRLNIIKGHLPTYQKHVGDINNIQRQIDEMR